MASLVTYKNLTVIDTSTTPPPVLADGGAAINDNFKAIADQFQGAWSSTVAYTINQIVNYNGSTYICTVANTNQPPPNSNWTAFAGTDLSGYLPYTGATSSPNLGAYGITGNNWAINPDGSVSFDSGNFTSDGSGELTVQAISSVGGNFSINLMGELTAAGGGFNVDSLGDISTSGSLSTDRGNITSDGSGNLTAFAYFLNPSNVADLQAGFIPDYPGLPIVDFGLNAAQFGAANSTYSGGIFRLDSRGTYPFFQILYQPTGDIDISDQLGPLLITNPNTTGIMPSVLIGWPGDGSENTGTGNGENLQVYGNTYTGGNAQFSGDINVTGNGTFTQTIAIAQALTTSGSTVSWDMNMGQVGTLTLGTNATLANPTHLRVSTYILKVEQDSTGGRTLSYGSAYKWPGGTSPTLSTAANAVDILTFFCDGTYMFGIMQKAFA